jgi:hypothetical protein
VLADLLDLLAALETGQAGVDQEQGGALVLLLPPRFWSTFTAPVWNWTGCFGY